MDNSSLDKHDLPETSEILAPFGSIDFEGSLRSQKNTLTVDDETVRSTRPVFRESSEVTQRPLSRPAVGGVFLDNETRYRRKESVVYAQKGKAEVTFINIQLDKISDQDIGKAKVYKATDDKSTPKTAIQHHRHFAEEESLKESPGSPSIHITGSKDTTKAKPGPLYVSGDTNSRTFFTRTTELSGSSSGLVLDPGKLHSGPSRPLREEEMCYVRKPTTVRVVGVRRLSEGSSPSGEAIGDLRTTHGVDISTIQHSDGSSVKTSQPAPTPGRDNTLPPGRRTSGDGVFDKGNTETTRPGTSVRGTEILERKVMKVTETGMIHSRAELSSLVSRDTKYIDVSSPEPSAKGVSTSRSTSYIMNTDPASSQLTERNYNTTLSTESSGAMLKRHITVPDMADSPTSATSDSAFKRITRTPRHINVVNSDRFQDVDYSTVSGLVPDLTATAQNTASSEPSAPASQRNSVASGCSYVSSIVDSQSRLDLERCSPTHFHTKWRLYSTERSGTEGLKEDCSVEIRPDIFHVKDTRPVTSTTKDSKELHSSNTDKITRNTSSRDSATGNYIYYPGNPALSDQKYETTTTQRFIGTVTDTGNKHGPKISVRNTGNDRAAKLIEKDNPYFPHGKRTKPTPREQLQSPHMVDIPPSQRDQGKKTKIQIHNHDMTSQHRDLITSKARVNKQSPHMVEIPRPCRNQMMQTSESHDNERDLTGELTKRSNYEVGYSSPTDATCMVQQECAHVLNETEDSSGSDEAQGRRLPVQERRRKDGRIEHYNGKDIVRPVRPGRAESVKHRTMSQHADTRETYRATSDKRADNPGFPTEEDHTCYRSSTDTRDISGKAGKKNRADDAVGSVEGNEARDIQITHRNPKKHSKHHDDFEYPTQSMRDATLVSKGYAGVIAPGVLEYNDNSQERSNVVGENEINGHQSVMDRVKSWVVSHDTTESTVTRDPSRDNTDSPRPFDRHSIAEMPLKVLETAVPIDQEDVYPDEVFEDGTRSVRDHPGMSVGDPRYLEPREDLPIDEHLHVHHDVLIREDPEGSEGLARRRFDSLSTDPRTVYSRSLSDGIRKIEESRSEQVSIEMAELGDRSDVMVTRHQSEGAIFNTSLLDGWEPSSPYAHRVKRNSSTLSEGAQPVSAGKPKVRQLSLAIGEEWEDMTGTHPVTSPDGTGSVAVSQRSLRRERSQQRSWSGCSTSSAPMFLGRTIRYMSHPARLENYLRRNTIPEGNEPVTNPPSPPATTTAEAVDVEERKPTQLETNDDEKRWLTPNPYNRINQRFHSTLQCPCYLFFCFLCCVPAVYYMQISDKEYDYGSKEKSRVYGRRATVLYVIGAISATIFLSTVTSLVVIFMQEYLTRQQT